MTLPCSISPLSENDLFIDQGQENGIDTCTCQLNSLLNSINDAINDLDIDQPITIDIDNFLKCNNSEFNNSNYPGIESTPNDANYIRETGINHYISQGFTQQQAEIRANILVSNFNTSIKAVQWLTSSRLNKFTNTVARRRKLIKFYLKCEDSTQTYTNDPASCDLDCMIEVPVMYKTKKRSWTIERLMRELNRGPVVGAIDLNPNYFQNFLSDGASNELIAVIDNFSQNLGYKSHAVSIIGYECSGNYVIFTFKDSYSYGTNVKRPGIFKVAVNKSVKIAPFGVGIQAGRNRNVVITGTFIPLKDKKRVANQINEAFKKCCETPTPTSSATSTPTPTPTATITPTPSLSLPPPTPSYT